MNVPIKTATLLTLGCLTLSACGSSEVEGPKEQIIVSEPGETDTQASAEAETATAEETDQ